MDNIWLAVGMILGAIGISTLTICECINKATGAREKAREAAKTKFYESRYRDETLRQLREQHISDEIVEHFKKMEDKDDG